MPSLHDHPPDEPTPVHVVRISLPFSDALAITLTLALAGVLVGAVLGVVWFIVRSVLGLVW